VLRLKVGDAVELADPDGGVVVAGTIRALHPFVQVQPQSAPTTTLPDQLTALGPQTPITLLFALCKGQKNDQVCDWATELGCAHILFWQAHRSIVRLADARDRAHKEQRLEKIALAAAQQSRQARPPRVTVALSLSAALATPSPFHDPTPLKAICSLEPGAQPYDAALQPVSATSSLHLAIGPEGAFTPEEELTLQQAGFIPVSLGNAVLRSELAAVVAITAARRACERRSPPL
jgi:16S rRNA (uracil1498-N3)-methyltransferase